jgi:hypothetical protein
MPARSTCQMIRRISRLLVHSIVAALCAGCAATPSTEDNFVPAYWRTIETIGCFERSPGTDQYFLPEHFRLDVQVNRATLTVDSVIGTAGQPAHLRRSQTGWWLTHDSIGLLWSFGMENILVKARLNGRVLAGHARHGSDWGGGSTAEVSAKLVSCTDSIDWVRASTSGGRR